MDYHGTSGDDVIDQAKLQLAAGVNIYGDGGNDTITIGSAIAIGGAGNDTIIGISSNSIAACWGSPKGVTVDLSKGSASDGFGGTDTLVNIRNVQGSSYDDILIGSSADETFYGGAGNNTVTGGGGTDRVNYYFVKSTDAQISYDARTDTFTVIKHFPNGDNGTDTLRGISKIAFSGTSSDNVTLSKYNFDSTGAFLLSTAVIPSRAIPNTGVLQIKIGDFNGDGQLDFVVSRINNSDLGATPSPLQIYEGDGHGNFTDQTSMLFPNGIPLVHDVQRIFVADFNGDGISDIFCPDFGQDLTSNGGQNELFLSSKTTNTLINATGTLPQVIAQNHGASMGDVSGDGYLDILVNTLNNHTGQSNQLLINDGTGHFSPSPKLLPAQLPAPAWNPGNTWSLLADLNSDGGVDMVLGTMDTNPNPSQVFLNNGHGDFSHSVPVNLPRSGLDKEVVVGIEPIDLNGDSLPDLVLSVTNGGDNNTFYRVPYVELLVNDGNGHFHDETAIRLPQNKVATAPGSPEDWYLSVKAVDLNHDGFSDLVVDGGANATSKAYLNDGHGNFSLAFETPPAMKVAVGDVNGDGMPDLISTSMDGSGFSVWTNNLTNGHIYKANFGGDSLLGSGGNDTFFSGNGDDTFNGNGGTNTCVFAGIRWNYTIISTPAGLTVKDRVGHDGADTLSNIGRLQFADTIANLEVATDAATISHSQLDSLTELYIAYFNRVPDAGGLDYWIKQLKAGQSLEQIGATFYSAAISPQFSSLTGYSSSMTNGDFVKVIYANVLGRSGTNAPAAADVDYWAHNLATGVDTRGSLVNTMLQSAHSFRGNTTWGWVANLLDNKVSVGEYHAVTAGVDYLTSQEAVTKGMAIASAITATDTSAAINLIGLSSVVPYIH